MVIIFVVVLVTEIALVVHPRNKNMCWCQSQFSVIRCTQNWRTPVFFKQKTWNARVSHQSAIDSKYHHHHYHDWWSRSEQSLTHVRVVVDHTVPTRLQISAKWKSSHWFNWSVYASYQVFIFCRKSILSNRFTTLYSHSQPFNETFTISSKSCCCTCL